MSPTWRRWLAGVPAAAWGLSLVTNGAKTQGSLALIETLLLGGLGAWMYAGGKLLRENWQKPLAAFGLWLPVTLLSPGSLTDHLLHAVWIVSLTAFFFMARYLWNEREHELFLSSIVGAGIINILCMVLQATRGAQPLGLFSANPNYSGTLIVAAILVSLVRLRHRFSFYGITLFLLIAGLSRLHSRGAWLALAVGVSCVAYRRWKMKGILAAAALLSLWILLLPGHYAFELSKLGSGPDALARPLIWKSAVAMITEYPVTGWGAGNFEQGFQLHPVLSRDGLFQYEKTTVFAHSLYLQIAAELGIPALLFFLWAAGSFWKSTEPDAETRPLLIALLVQGAFDMIFALPALSLLLVGAAAATAPRPDRESAVVALDGRARKGVGVLALGAVLLLGVAPRWDNLSDSGFWENQAALRGQDHAWGEAFLAYEKAEDLDPYHAPLYCEAGELALFHGDAPRAEEEFRKCLDLEPNALRAWRGLAAALRGEGRRLEAARLESSLRPVTDRIQKQLNNSHQNPSHYAVYLLGF